MGNTAVRLTTLFGKAVRPKAESPEVSQTTRIDFYEILQCLGSGGMGTVYKAHDEKLDRVVALKVMLKDFRGDPELLDAFRSEARAVAKINHPNIAQIYSLGENKGKPYIVMEYVAGSHLDSLVFSPKPLDQAKVMWTGMKIAAGLRVAADAGLVHGDIKPENIVYDDSGVPKLLDFGIASASNAKSTSVWGTPYYISPEKIRNRRVDFRSDIYCLGGTLYHALTKHPPYENADVREVLRAHLFGPPEPMSKYRPDIDPEVEAIISRMLQIDPADRYPTYGALIADIRKYLRRVNPALLVSNDMFAQETLKTAPQKKRQPFWKDFKSQVILLLILVALFPYVFFFYARPMLLRNSSGTATEPAPPPAKTEPLLATPPTPPPETEPAVEPTNSAETPVEEPADVPAEEPPDATVKPPPAEVTDEPPPAEPHPSTLQPLNPQHSTPQTSSATASAEPQTSNLKPQTSPATAPAHEVIDLPSADEIAEIEWPSLKVTAIIGTGETGNAIVNGDVIPVGYSFDNGITLKAVEPHSATFELKGATKKVFVSKPEPKTPSAKKPQRK